MSHFMSDRVLNEFRKDSTRISSFMQILVKSDKTKIWKNDHFTFGKRPRKGGKEPGLIAFKDMPNETTCKQIAGVAWDAGI